MIRIVKNIGFVCFFIISILLVKECFAYADRIRGYDALGGEVFMIALPFLLIMWKLENRAKRTRKQ